MPYASGIVDDRYVRDRRQVLLASISPGGTFIEELRQACKRASANGLTPVAERVQRNLRPEVVTDGADQIAVPQRATQRRAIGESQQRRPVERVVAEQLQRALEFPTQLPLHDLATDA